MRVLLVDDHALFLQGLHNLLLARGIEVVGTARDGVEALGKVRELSPDIVLMDIRMPRCDGLSATRLIKAEFPESRIIMLTTSDEETDLLEAIKSGACGYLLKSLEADPFILYLEGVMRGEAAISGAHASLLLKEFVQRGSTRSEPTEERPTQPARPPLSVRQRQILELVAQGMLYKEVARQLNLSERTVKYHMGEIVRVLHLKNREQVIAYALSTGLVKPIADASEMEA